MIKLGTVKDMYKVSHLSDAMQERIGINLQILDDNYGTDRDIEHDLGGFVAVIENEADDAELLKKYNLDMSDILYEYEDRYNDFTEHLYILGSDYAIVVFSMI